MAEGILDQGGAIQAIWSFLYQKYLQRDRGGKASNVNHATGLPESPSDLKTGARVVSGIDLVMDTIIPPRRLAAASVAVLPPPPPGQSEETGWGSEEDHWQVLAYKPEYVTCPTCKGTSPDPEIEAQAVLARGPSYEPKPPCDTCSGRGRLSNWTQEEIDVVDHNTLQIKLALRDMVAEGYFNPNPINEKDPLFKDQVWEDRAGFSLGLAPTWKGWKACEEYIDKRPELKKKVHILTYAGQEVRDQAPQWAKDEYDSATLA